ncbi:MAG TPA: A/G-specific adenine glycosylase [Candidatus Methylomirabilis sp.]|nr:A/G-specific adenine glycosylase [Candidatus Methylomirabilis sp.]
MLARREITSFRKELLNWFRRFRRDLPWRRTKDAYRIWVSEIMLQQTRVAAVIPYYERFLERFPHLHALAEAPEEEVLRLWAGLGYYSRARNLQKAARQIVAQHGGRFPRVREALRELPGIGDYTAAAILSIAFGAKRAVLDGNVARVLARLGAVRGDVREPKRWKSLQKTADGLLDPKSSGDWNQAMMELGATVCTPRAPQCLLCPVAKFCRARQLGDPESFPEKKPKRETVEIALAAAVLNTPSGETLLLPPPNRTEKKPAADDIGTLVSRMWHFPTVVVRSDPSSNLREFLAALLPRKNSATAFEPFTFEPLGRVMHAVTYRKVTILPFRVAVKKIPRVPGARILPLEELSSLPISNLTRKIARKALARATEMAASAQEMQDAPLWRAAAASQR